MTVERAIKEAERVKQYLEEDDEIIPANTIEGLIRIIYWYDANQRRLIKALSRQLKKNKSLKNIVTLMMAGDDSDTE